MNKVVLLLAYQGTHYSGWQRQPKDISIQETIETSLSRITKTCIPVTSSGRTDAGVHAYGQVAHFPLPYHPIFAESRSIKKVLNALLPHDIVVRDAVITDDNFHSRFSACAKEYHYSLTQTTKPLPWQRSFCYAPRHPLAIDQMQEGAQLLLGTHDFASFANHGREYTSTIRTLYKLQIIDNPEQDLISIVCQGNGFLYKMVRNLVGALLDVGKRKYPPQHLLHILEQKNRRCGPAAVPGYGLSLHHVCYPYPYNWFCSCACNKAFNEGNENKDVPDKSV